MSNSNPLVHRSRASGQGETWPYHILADLRPVSGRDALRRVLDRASGQGETSPCHNLTDPRPALMPVVEDKFCDFAEVVLVVIYALAAFAEIAMLLMPAA
ncbi:MAG: hypothetical protein WB586_07205 [Chthoniobacterales bacterium]